LPMNQWKASSGVQTIGSVRNIEARVDQNGAAGLGLETLAQRVEARIGVGMHDLHAGRVVDVGNRRDIRARHIELVDAEELLLLVCHATAPRALHVGNQQRVG
jgi:hypothetical protein